MQVRPDSGRRHEQTKVAECPDTLDARARHSKVRFGAFAMMTPLFVILKTISDFVISSYLLLR